MVTSEGNRLTAVSNELRVTRQNTQLERLWRSIVGQSCFEANEGLRKLVAQEMRKPQDRVRAGAALVQVRCTMVMLTHDFRHGLKPYSKCFFSQLTPSRHGTNEGGE